MIYQTLTAMNFSYYTAKSGTH